MGNIHLHRLTHGEQLKEKYCWFWKPEKRRFLGPMSVKENKTPQIEPPPLDNSSNRPKITAWVLFCGGGVQLCGNAIMGRTQDTGSDRNSE